MNFCVLLSFKSDWFVYAFIASHMYIHTLYCWWFIEFMKFLYPAGLADAFSTDNLTMVSKFHPSFPYLSLGEKVIVMGSLEKKFVM